MPRVGDHVDWLLSYQFKKQSLAEIAKIAGFHTAEGPDVVDKAIRRVAKLIELPLAPRRRGRPSTGRKKIQSQT